MELARAASRARSRRSFRRCQARGTLWDAGDTPHCKPAQIVRGQL